MNQTSQVERENNVINVSFSKEYDSSSVPHDIAHPASRYYPEDDLIGDLLSEFDDLVEDDNEQEIGSIDNTQYAVDYEDSVKSMADTILDQIKRLKEDSKRLRYYLDELNLD